MKIVRRCVALIALATVVLFAAGTAPPLKAPIAVFVHGGGWVSGTPAMGDPLSGFFRGRQFLFASIDYPKPPAVPLMTSVEQVERQIAVAVRSGPSVVVAHSAGAHLAATAAFRPDAPPIRCLILLDGVGYDLVGLLKSNPTLQQRLGLTWRQAAALSPAELATDSMRRPAVLLAAGGDARGTADQARKFAWVLRGSGMDVTVKIFPDAAHNDFRTAFLDPNSPIAKAASAFLAAHPGCSK